MEKTCEECGLMNTEGCNTCGVLNGVQMVVMQPTIVNVEDGTSENVASLPEDVNSVKG